MCSEISKLDCLQRPLQRDEVSYPGLIRFEVINPSAAVRELVKGDGIDIAVDVGVVENKR